MSKRELKDLVPPLELCKQIPSGAFEDSALVWFGHDKVYFPPPVHSDMEVVPRNELGVTCHVFLETGVRQLYPAPTLAEILEKFDRFAGASRFKHQWMASYEKHPEGEFKWGDLIEIRDTDAATAALRLFLGMEARR